VSISALSQNTLKNAKELPILAILWKFVSLISWSWISHGNPQHSPPKSPISASYILISGDTWKIYVPGKSGNTFWMLSPVWRLILMQYGSDRLTDVTMQKCSKKSKSCPVSRFLLPLSHGLQCALRAKQKKQHCYLKLAYIVLYFIAALLRYSQIISEQLSPKWGVIHQCTT